MGLFRNLIQLVPPLLMWLFLFAICPAAQGADWSHPRGPHRTGVIEGSSLVSEWPAEGPPVLWRRSIGQGYSGFVVAEGRFYTQFQTSAGQQIACCELDSGKEVWRTRYGLPWQLDGDWPGPYASPVFAEDHIYFSGCFGEVGRVRPRDGKLLWSVNVQERFDGRGTEFGYACTPLVENDMVYLPVGGEGASVVALDAKTGKLRWKSGSEPASYVGSLAITVDGQRQIVSVLQNLTVGHDADSGTELWRHTRGRGYAEHAAWPIWSPPYLFYSEPFREGAHVLKLDHLDGKERMSEVWHSNVICNDIFSSVIVDGYIYGFDIFEHQAIHEGQSDGHFTCIELTTGREMWAVTNTAHAMVLTDQKNLVIFNELGELILADASPEEYRERARTRLFQDVQCWVAPAYYDGRLLVRAKTEILCVYLGDTNAPGFEKLLAGGGDTVIPKAQPGLFDRYRSDAYFAPTLGDLSEWFWISILGVILPAVGVALMFQKRVPLGWLMGGGAVVAGAVACPIFTAAFERLMFTWPVAIHAGYFAVVQTCAAALGDNSKRSAWIARGGLLGLILGGLFYHELCEHYFIVMGWGFLVGILPALPFTLSALRRMAGGTKRGSTPALIAIWIISFAIFYWSSAMFILWRT